MSHELEQLKLLAALHKASSWKQFRWSCDGRRFASGERGVSVRFKYPQLANKTIDAPAQGRL